MSDVSQRTLSASVPPQATPGSSSPIRGLSPELLQAPSSVALASVKWLAAVDPDNTSAKVFFALFACDVE